MNGATRVKGDTRSARGGRWRAPNLMRAVATARALLDFTPEDEQLIRRSADVLVPHADAIARGLYRRLLSRPETATYFSLPNGRPDRAYLMERTESLRAWLQHVIEAPLDEQMVSYSASVGQAHARPERGARSVRGRYMVVTMAVVFAALCPLLEEAITDRGEMVATIAAWNKLLTIQLDLFLAVYGAAAGSAHWY